MYKMTVLAKIKPYSDAVAKLPFYEQLTVTKTDQAFTGYALSYKVGIIEKKDPVVQLEASKLSIEYWFSDLLKKTKGFKYQITVKILLKEYKLNGEVEFAPFCFNSVTKPKINHRLRLENPFQEILYMIEVGINNGSGWNVESLESEYINISAYIPLSGSFYMKLPIEL